MRSLLRRLAPLLLLTLATCSSAEEARVDREFLNYRYQAETHRREELERLYERERARSEELTREILEIRKRIAEAERELAEVRSRRRELREAPGE